MRKTSARLFAALVLFSLTAPAGSQPLRPAPSPRPGFRSSEPARQALEPPPDVIAVFTRALRPGSRVTVGLMDNQKLKGEFLGVDAGRVLFRADRDRSVTLRISLRAIHSIKVRNGGAIARP